MNRNSAAVFLLGLGVLVTTLRCGGTLSLADRPCPCADGNVCCSNNNTCVPEGTLCGNSRVQVGAADGGGSSLNPVVEGDGAPGSGVGAYAPPCPQTEPAAGTPCSVPSEFAACTYGTYTSSYCNHSFKCSGGDSRFGTANTWTRDTDFEYSCPRAGDGDGNGPPLEDSACPATFAAVAQGTACSANEVLCAYPDGIGIVCSCSMGPGGGGPSHPYQWVCSSVPPGCPIKPPNLGQACSGATMCDYGSCVFSSAPTPGCENGAWADGEGRQISCH